MGGMVVVGGVLAGRLGLGNTVVGLVGVLIGLLHLGRCLGAGIVVGLSEGGIVVVGGNVVVKALGGKVDVVVCMCGNVAVGGIVGISVKVALNKETKTCHGNIMILQAFPKELCYHINCETDGGPGLFWTESSSQFCHINTGQKY